MEKDGLNPKVVYAAIIVLFILMFWAMASIQTNNARVENTFSNIEEVDQKINDLNLITIGNLNYQLSEKIDQKIIDLNWDIRNRLQQRIREIQAKTIQNATAIWTNCKVTLFQTTYTTGTYNERESQTNKACNQIVYNSYVPSGCPEDERFFYMVDPDTDDYLVICNSIQETVNNQ